jgi:hypothetical protein
MSLKIEYAAIAQCNPDHLWRVFDQIELWPRWDPEAIREVHWVSGEPWSKGAKFSIQMLKPMAFTLTPEVMAVDAPVFLHLSGEGSGITGEQFYIFRWIPDSQTTEMRTLQEFSGMAIDMFGSSVKSALESGIRHMFTRVIEEAEAHARAELPPSTLFAEPPPLG